MSRVRSFARMSSICYIQISIRPQKRSAQPSQTSNAAVVAKGLSTSWVFRPRRRALGIYTHCSDLDVADFGRGPGCGSGRRPRQTTWQSRPPQGTSPVTLAPGRFAGSGDGSGRERASDRTLAEPSCCRHADAKKPLESPPAVLQKWSGRRDSNSRRPPWQGGALPTELRPRNRESEVNRPTLPSTAIFPPRSQVLPPGPGSSRTRWSPVAGFPGAGRACTAGFAPSL